MYFNAILPNHSTLSLSHRVQKTVLYISVSFAVSYTGLLLPSFSIPYICVSILYWCFSFWLTSLCIIGSKVKRQPSALKKIIANEATDKQLISKIPQQPTAARRCHLRGAATGGRGGPRRPDDAEPGVPARCHGR